MDYPENRFEALLEQAAYLVPITLPDELRGHLLLAFRGVVVFPAVQRVAAGSLVPLLDWLCVPEHRTDEHCRFVEAFFAGITARDLASLPEPLAGLVFDLASNLHDAITAPEVAANFESTPEQLLSRARSLAAGE